jgi:hypothetical protein
MKEVSLIAIMLFLFCFFGQTQEVQIDLANRKAAAVNDFDIDTKSVRLLNRSKIANYKLEWKFKNKPMPFLNIPAAEKANLSSTSVDLNTCNADVKRIIAILDGEIDEVKIKKAVEEGRALLAKGSAGTCAATLETSMSETESVEKIPRKLQYNQEVTLTVTKTDKAGKELGVWTYTFNTEEHTRWLTHFGLTYAPSIISKVDHYYSQDSTVASTYRIAKQNNNGPKPWENISATINFTYPFVDKSEGLNGGFTAGFGLNPTMQLSGHTGLSALIGTNVFLGTGVVFMQKQRLRGEFSENKIIKTNLTFDALHEKVWLPELYFTIGFRFNKNPFGGSSDKKETPADKKPAATGNQ